MYKNNRLKQIQSYLEIHGTVDISTLSRELEVSEMTIRRDIGILVNRGSAIRTHGGAMLPREHYVGDIYMDSRSQLHVEEKKAIAKAAVSELRPGDSIFIDDGSTVTAMAQFIPHNIQLRITTTSMWAALEFNKYPNVEVISLGGIVSKTTKSVIGPTAIEHLKNMYFTSAFIGVPYITVDGIITSNSMDDLYIKKAAIQQSKKAILLMDSSKIHKEPMNLRLASIEDFHLIITDDHVPPYFIDQCIQRNISVQAIKP